MSELDTSELAGSITAVPIVSMESFRQRSPFVVPADGKNLNRSFPGSYDGTYTDRLAASIFEQLIEPADVLLDLHGGDLVEALEPFAIYDASPHEERTHAIALAFGLPYVVRQELDESGLGGMTSSAAARAGIPAVIAEAGGCGQLEEAATAMLVDGVRNVLRHLEMLPGEPDRAALARRREVRLVPRLAGRLVAAGRSRRRRGRSRPAPRLAAHALRRRDQEAFARRATASSSS